MLKVTDAELNVIPRKTILSITKPHPTRKPRATAHWNCNKMLWCYAFVQFSTTVNITVLWFGWNEAGCISCIVLVRAYGLRCSVNYCTRSSHTHRRCL